ncbi:sigma factor-like helix-turn-helix DNA-binding protein [Sphingomonas glacialis]|uniref:RNA polymerase subunit sigma-70 n=1 Tax=Sphingomonas glacialis TaxID=658225 RepID=A0A502FZU6_9SPHN|nr:sigma factor-like helix-turn-helix DNA-binding protein [Sphingomonas glacialis]TPG55044.1 RNA polymerase subunit sigma-70 [Sphingomonas glacialis]
MTGDREDVKARSTERDKGEWQGPVPPEQLATMERAMLSLPRMTREVFLAHRLDGASYFEIAGATGLSIRQVERHMAKALLRLSRFMDGDERTPWRRWWNAQCQRWFP